MFLLFDIGGTTTRMALSRTGDALDEVKLFPTNHNFSEAMAYMKGIAEEFSRGEKYHAVVGGVRAYDPKKGQLFNQPHFPMWVGEPLLLSMQSMWGESVFLNNDAAMVALGEATYGAGKGKKIVAYITLSTGVGGCRIVGGKIDNAYYGFEPGNMLIGDKSGRQEYLEKLVSGTALKEKYGKIATDITDSAIWEEVCEIIAVGLNNVSVMWSPEIIILGGSVPQKLDIEKVKMYLKKFLKIYPEAPEVKKAELDEMGGLYGGLAYLQKLP